MEPKKYFVLTFNPIRWAEGGWEREDFEEWLRKFKGGSTTIIPWSIQSFKQAKKGDMCFFLVQGEVSRGIFGAGEIVKEAYEDVNWNGDGKLRHYVLVKCKKLTDYLTPFVSTNELKQLVPKYNWTPMSGGLPMDFETAKALMCRLKWNLL